MYIGSTSVQTEPLWLLSADGRQMVWCEASYVPGLYKIFDEILVNALDNRQRDPSTDEISVSIDAETGATVITNTGRGIPIRRDEAEGVWIPEMVMGSLFSGSNFNDGEKRTVGGRHGFGAKLTNLFSHSFEVQTADSDAGLLYTQRWANNMSESSPPLVEPLPPGGRDFTRVRFVPDLGRFGLQRLHPDMLAIFRRRVHEAAATAAPARLLLDGERVPVHGLSELAAMYAGAPLEAGRTLALATPSARWTVGACLSPTGSFQVVSFVNGVATPRGGTHVNHVAAALLNDVAPLLSRALGRGSAADEPIPPSRIKQHLMLFVDCKVDNPEFDSQSKEALTTPAGLFGGACDLPRGFVKGVASLPGLEEAVAADLSQREQRALARRTSSSGSTMIDVPKLEDAELAGGAHASECTLIVTEGDSAKALAVSGLSVIGRDYYGVFPLRGKLLNVRDANHSTIMANKVRAEC